MTNLFDMNNRLAQWQGEKASAGDWANELRLRNGDVVFFQFVANGDEGDRFIKAFRAHEVPTTFKGGKSGSVIRYCPTANGEPGDCAYCIQGLTTMKERMSMWLYVFNILHTQMPADKQFPQVNHQGRFYFNEEVKGFRIWHNSAWRESPWIDIMKLFELYKGLHNFTGELDCLGDGTARRYKLYAISQDGLNPAIYEQAKSELKPVGEILREQMSSAVVAAPASPASPVGQVVQPFAAPGNAATPFTPLFTAPSPTQAAPSTAASPLPFQPPPQTASPAPGAAGATLIQTPVQEQQPPSPSAPVQEQNTGSDPAVPVDTDSRRPLQSLF